MRVFPTIPHSFPTIRIVRAHVRCSRFDVKESLAKTAKSSTLEPELVHRLRKQPEDNLHTEDGGQRHQPQPERWRALSREEYNRKNGDHSTDFADATRDCESRIVDGLNRQVSIFCQPALARKFQ